MTHQIVINDPKTPNSWVYLRPNSEIKLVLKDCKLSEWDDDFLNQIHHEICDNQEIYVFRQNEKIAKWPELSQTFLGEIKLDKPEGEACIGVVLDSQQNPYTMTAINPQGSQIKLRPNHILEIVILNHGPNDVYESTIGEGFRGLKYAPLSVGPSRRQFPVPSRSYHFSLSKNLLYAWPSGMYYAGYVVLTNKADNKIKYMVVLDLKIKSSKKDKVFYTQKEDEAESYQEVKLLPKPFSDMSEGCNIRGDTWP